MVVFCCGRLASDRESRCVNVKIVLEWKGMLESNVVKIIKGLLRQCCKSVKHINMWTLVRSTQK